MSKIKSFLIFLLLLQSTFLFSQSTTLSAGGDITESDGSLSYSIGQVFYGTITHSDGMVQQGIQQPYEIYILSNENQVLAAEINVYPNPATDYLRLNIENYQGQSYQYKLYNAAGSMIEGNVIKNSTTRINFSDLISGTYLLQIIYQQDQVQTFKIIKN